MKKITYPTIILTSLLFAGCTSSFPLTIQEHGAPIARSIGKDVGDLKYVSFGDFAPFDEIEDGFNATTKGTFVLTNESIYWREGQDFEDPPRPFQEIPISSVSGVAMDQSVLQLVIDNRVHLLRITQWNRHQESIGGIADSLRNTS